MNPLILAALAINLLAFAQMGIDKHLAKKGARRISEAQLIAPTLLGGIAGILLGMLAFHHKTKKTSFQIKLALALMAFGGLLFLVFFNT